MTARLILRGHAERHIADIRDWCAEQSPGLDAEFGTTLDEALTAIADMPRIGRLSESGRRRFAMRRFPYLVWCTVHDEVGVVRVLAITHQRREPYETGGHVGV